MKTPSNPLAVPAFLSLILLFTLGCQPTPETGEGGGTGVDTSGVMPGYWRLKGNVGEQDIVMHLIQRLPHSADDRAYFQGYYYDVRFEEPIPFYGETDSLDRLIITEAAVMDDNPATFTGVWTDDGNLEGRWTDNQGGRERSFYLSQDYPAGSVMFDVRHLSDSLPLRPGRPASPQGRMTYAWLEPGIATEAALAAFLREEIRRGALGDSLAALYAAIPDGFAGLRDTFFAQYRRDAAYLDEGDTLGAATFNYEQNQGPVVYYNQNDRLTLGFTSYSYLGGAHGMYATQVRTYDTKNRRRLTLADVFRPGYETAMRPVLEKAVRRLFKLDANTPLTEVLFENEIAPNDNFGLTGTGIFFTYAPYEIAAYAFGEIELFIPFTEIQGLLQDGFDRRK